MDKLVVTDLNTKERRDRVRATKVPTRRSRGADGKVETVYVLDTADPHFNDQFLKVFQMNVTKARRRKPVHSHVVAAE